MNLDETINEALELNVIKDGDLKLPIDQIVVRDYDEVVGYAGRVRKPMVDWVTEYNYVSKENLTQEQFDEKIKEAGHNPVGMISYKKHKLTYGNGDVYYRHICKAVMF